MANALRIRGLALIVVIGILGVLAVLAVAFVAMAQLERRASEQRLNGARAYLLARSGIEDALARLELGQDPAYAGEDWDGNGVLTAGLETTEQVYQPGVLNVADCPARQAMRPSFFVDDRTGPGAPPALLGVDGRKRAYSGALSGNYAPKGNSYALKVSSSNAGIYINGGALDAQDRDPDGPGVKPENFPLNPGAAVEVAPLLPNKVPDHKDASMEGPNGFLVRLLNNLDAVVTNEATSNLGVQVVGARPVGGYESLDELKPVLGQARFDQFKPYLTLHAWVDPKVVKPQPMDGRPQRWEDIDDAHRIGTEAREISGLRTVAEGANPANGALLNPGILGHGAEADLTSGRLPWIQTISAVNLREVAKLYPVRWERNFVYARSQLRPAPPAPEPRAPLFLNGAAEAVLAAALSGLKGTYLDVWDGSAGWDGGFGWFLGQETASSYPYPSEGTEETPWIRTRVDYGMPRGSSTGSPPACPWYGPADYDPQALPVFGGAGGKPVIQAAPLGRLKETPALSTAQARAMALQACARVFQAGALRTWAAFDAFVDRLPRWEDVNEDGFLDGLPYPVSSRSGGTYTRRAYLREDLDGDGRLRREIFTAVSGSWVTGDIGWQDPGLPRQGLLPGTPSLGPGQVPGLTALQKCVARTMANPNADLNDFNPDANLWKEIDKADLAGIGTRNRIPPGGVHRPYDPEPDGSAYAHTTELSLDEGVLARVASLGRVGDPGGKPAALRQVAATLRLRDLRRDSTQADFRRPGWRLEAPSDLAYTLAGGLGLLSLPEPVPDGGPGSDSDGQIALGLIGPSPGPDDTLRGDLFGTADARGSGDPAVADLRCPSEGPLLGTPGTGTGNVFADGVYSEKDRTLRYGMAGNFEDLPHKDTLDASAGGRDARYSFYVACWAKPAWCPEASPRAHALLSLSRAAPTVPAGTEGSSFPFGDNAFDAPFQSVPMDDIGLRPIGLYFVPGRNNRQQDTMVNDYDHSAASNQGDHWPCRALLWGTPHSLFASDNLNRRGVVYNPPLRAFPPPRPAAHPVGRLEARRWQHLAVVGQVGCKKAHEETLLMVLGRVAGNPWHGGRWNFSFATHGDMTIGTAHVDGSPNHLRFGEMTSAHNMNYAADATFANVRAGGRLWIEREGQAPSPTPAYHEAFLGSASPGALGRYLKEDGAAYVSPPLPPAVRLPRITWTEVPCELWFDEDGDGWLGDAATGFRALNDRDGNSLRDVRIALEVWDDNGRLARFDDPAAPNRIPQPTGRLYYKAVFVNEWDAATRANHPLDVTPFLDDVTITYQNAGGPTVIAWDAGGEE